MPPKKRGNKKDGGGGGGGNQEKEKGSAEDQLWTALKRGDEERLTELLFTNIARRDNADGDDDDDTVTLLAKPASKQLLTKVNAKKRTPLTFAVEQGLEPELVVLLLRAGADVNGKDQTSEKVTALHCAALAEDEMMLSLLLKNGADVRGKNAHGETVLHTLADSHTAGALLEHLTDMVMPDRRATAEEEEGGTDGAADPFRIPGRRVIRVDPLQLLLPQGEDGCNPLHIALAEVSHGSSGAANAFIRVMERALAPPPATPDALSAALSAKRHGDGATPLHALLGSGNDANGDAAATVPVLARLLSLCGNSLDWSALDAERRTPLTLAIGRFAKPGEDTEKLFDLVLRATMRQKKNGDGDIIPLLTSRSGADEESLLHTVIVADNGSAAKSLNTVLLSIASDKASVVRALRTLTYKSTHSNGDDAELLLDLLRDRAAALAADAVRSGVSSGTNNDYRCVSESICTALLQLGVVSEDEVESVKKEAKAAAATTAEEMQAASRASGVPDKAGDAGGAEESSADEATTGLRQRTNTQKGGAGGAAGGLSRAQQSHKARTAAAAGGGGGGEASRGGHTRRRKGDPTASTSTAGEGWSTPAKVLVALLVLAAAFLVYTSFTNPVLTDSHQDAPDVA